MGKLLLKLTIGIIIFSILVWKTGTAKIIEGLSQYSLIAILLINLTTIASFLIGAAGMIILGKAINPSMPWKKGVNGVLAVTSLSLFIPGRAGDLTLPFFWKKFMNAGECITVVLIDKLITLFWVFFFGVYGFFFIFQSMLGIWIISGGAIGGMILLFLLLRMSSRKLIISFLPNKIVTLFSDGLNAFRLMIKRGKGRLLTAFVLAGVRTLVSGLGFWISLWGLNIISPFYYANSIMAVGQIISFIPVSIMGLGTLEAVCIYGMMQIDIAPNAVIVALTIGRIITISWLLVCLILGNFRNTLFDKGSPRGTPSTKDHPRYFAP